MLAMFIFSRLGKAVAATRPTCGFLKVVFKISRQESCRNLSDSVSRQCTITLSFRMAWPKLRLITHTWVTCVPSLWRFFILLNTLHCLFLPTASWGRWGRCLAGAHLQCKGQTGLAFAEQLLCARCLAAVSRVSVAFLNPSLNPGGHALSLLFER